MSEQRNLFSPFQLGPYELPNRVVMAPMTRSRAGAGNTASPLAATYYAQRATAGLIVSEASQVSPQGVGYPDTPGIHTDEQVAAWRVVTDAVHAAGGRIFLQLWHVGRVSHRAFQPGGELPGAPSAVGFTGQVYTAAGPLDYETPRALDRSEIAGIVAAFEDGARRAYTAGFDGVELHGANGYLIDQFLQDGSNQRTDDYGGTPLNRARFLLEVMEAVTGVWGGDRVGVRLSPAGGVNGMSDGDPLSTFSHAVSSLNRFNPAYLHVTEALGGSAERISPALRAIFRGPFIVNGGYDLATGNAAVQRGDADLVAYGVPFISNPDLVRRFRLGAPLAPADRATFYGGDEHGYTDYPVLETAGAR